MHRGLTPHSKWRPILMLNFERLSKNFNSKFVLQPISDVRSTIAERIKTNEGKIEQIQANKDYLQKSVKDQEDNIREMLSHRK
ncbi:Prefoldin subunit 1 [Exaiptasia diaphana]|nr:Prefoldin subunit 1 [Exaiptasia diaphana]